MVMGDISTLIIRFIFILLMVRNFLKSLFIYHLSGIFL